ncbi:hypothetical protein HOO54_21605 [Bacillus sp. WMMC1349]|uniref:hypothetical protein n=1 Tax=Bacillus sp. WMMC1349 TaxID=2736254 RepID=UPI0015549C00|nr:hypothetical protein [Bacillus sp. WMMC1349]NPC94748.1 hypothetical protein [Bacillus sp. WMMC1349]
MVIEGYKMKRVVVREELVELLGCPKKELLLNQFLYWIVRRYDYVQFYNEEMVIKAENKNKTDEGALVHGWIYKNSDELGAEVILKSAPTTIRRHLKQTVKWGYLHERRNPKVQYDKTFQYRLNTNKILRDLNILGFKIDYLLLIDKGKHQLHFANSKMKFPLSITPLQYQRLLQIIH